MNDEIENWKAGDYAGAAAKLKDKKILGAIIAHVEEKYEAKLYLCKKRKGNLSGEINFLIELNRTINYFELSAIIYFITDLTKYPKIFVEPKRLYEEKTLNKLYSAVTPYSETNFKEFSKLLDSDNPKPVLLSKTDFFDQEDKALDFSADAVLLKAFKYMELAAAKDPTNSEKLIQKAKELASPKDTLVK